MARLELATPKMLIVDDVDDNREILARLFRNRGYEIFEAANGPAALSIVKEKPLDILLLDIMMPSMCGIETLQRVRESFSAERLPIIMVTARSQSEDVVTALELGANDYITKPLDFEVAVARVAAHIEHKQALDALDRTVAHLGSNLRQLERELLYLRRANLLENVAGASFGRYGAN